MVERLCMCVCLCVCLWWFGYRTTLILSVSGGRISQAPKTVFRIHRNGTAQYKRTKNQRANTNEAGISHNENKRRIQNKATTTPAATERHKAWEREKKRRRSPTEANKKLPQTWAQTHEHTDTHTHTHPPSKPAAIENQSPDQSQHYKVLNESDCRKGVRNELKRKYFCVTFAIIVPHYCICVYVRVPFSTVPTSYTLLAQLILFRPLFALSRVSAFCLCVSLCVCACVCVRACTSGLRLFAHSLRSRFDCFHFLFIYNFVCVQFTPAITCTLIWRFSSIPFAWCSVCKICMSCTEYSFLWYSG